MIKLKRSIWNLQPVSPLFRSPNRLSQFNCYTTATPAGQRDMTSHELHELGHVWGLGHDDCDKTVGDANKAVMWWQGFMGTTGEKRTPKPRDVARGQYIYGVK